MDARLPPLVELTANSFSEQDAIAPVAATLPAVSDAQRRHV
jgi:hypothetical protein